MPRVSLRARSRTASLPPALREIERELWADAEAEIDVALRVAPLIADGWPRDRIKRWLGIDQYELTRVLERLQRAHAAKRGGTGAKPGAIAPP